MPTLYGNALYELSIILRDFGYGSTGRNALTSHGEDARRIGQFVTADQQYLLGQRDTPGNMTMGRARVAEAIRPHLLGRHNVYIAVWFDTEPDATAYEGYDLHRLDNLRDGLGTVANTMYYAIGRNAHTLEAHFTAALSRLPLNNPLNEAQVRAASGALPEGLVFTPHEASATGGVDYIGTVSPTPELLESLPVRARAYATITVAENAGRATLNEYALHWSVEDGTWTLKYRQATIASAAIAASGVTAQSLVTGARDSYRVWLRMQWRRPIDNGEAERQAKIEEHRRRSKARFETFRSSKATSEVEVIPTLPFLPHGLASSRRWGIEIETGGARGIQAPGGGWTRKGDGSLRSAWDGYREVQDFEPYDREENIDISWHDCENYQNHMPHEQYYDGTRQEYAFRVNPNYVPVADCQNCGQRTRIVRVEPQTIVHRAQSGDCAEFVSPILISMHSNGLATLLEEVAKQPQNDTAGVHVHVEANDLNDTQIATLIYGYDMLEPIIEKSYRRSRRDYCARRDADNVLNAARAVKSKSGANLRGGNRYVTVNTNSLSRHGTIEFRAMGPVYDYNYLIRWAMFCREMVNSVVGGATQKDFGRVKKWEDVLGIFTRFGKEFVRAAIYEMSGEVSESARLSKEEKPLTTAAVNADLTAAFASIQEFLATATRESRTAAENIRGFGYAVSAGLTEDQVNAVASRLTTADERLVTV